MAISFNLWTLDYLWHVKQFRRFLEIRQRFPQVDLNGWCLSTFPDNSKEVLFAFFILDVFFFNFQVQPIVLQFPIVSQPSKRRFKTLLSFSRIAKVGQCCPLLQVPYISISTSPSPSPSSPSPCLCLYLYILMLNILD